MRASWKLSCVFGTWELNFGPPTAPKNIHRCPHGHQGLPKASPRRGGGGVGKDFGLILGSPCGPQNLKKSLKCLPTGLFFPSPKIFTKMVDPGTPRNLLDEALVQARAPISIFALARKRHQNDLPTIWPNYMKYNRIKALYHLILLSLNFLKKNLK